MVRRLRVRVLMVKLEVGDFERRLGGGPWSRSWYSAELVLLTAWGCETLHKQNEKRALPT